MKAHRGETHCSETHIWHLTRRASRQAVCRAKACQMHSIVSDDNAATMGSSSHGTRDKAQGTSVSALPIYFSSLQLHLHLNGESIAAITWADVQCGEVHLQLIKIVC